MINLTITKDVEIPCKTICKTPCINIAKLCVNYLPTTTHCVNPLFSHFLLTTISQAFTQHSTPIFQLSFPLFHPAYYYNY